MPGAPKANRTEEATSRGHWGVRGRGQRREGPGGKEEPEDRVLREDPTLTQREFPLLVPQRALRHHLQIQHWFGSPGRGGLPAAAQTGPELRTKQQLTRRPCRPSAALLPNSSPVAGDTGPTPHLTSPAAAAVVGAAATAAASAVKVACGAVKCGEGGVPSQGRGLGRSRARADSGLAPGAG